MNVKDAVFYQGVDLVLDQLPAQLGIATLGPSGTSSEAAARALSTSLLGRGHERATVALYPSYEQAARSVLDDETQLLVVANAYAGANTFYMNGALTLGAVFVKDTPDYGLASAKPVDESAPLSIASHPAPVPLIAELLPDGMTVKALLEESSTSAAAQAVVSGRADAALTTGPAAAKHGLSFFSRTRPIRMLWSVFVTAQLLARTPRRPKAMARSGW